MRAYALNRKSPSDSKESPSAFVSQNRRLPVQAKLKDESDESRNRQEQGLFSKRADFSNVPLFPQKSATSTSGRQLPNNLLNKMESAFGSNFSDVRIHEDASAKSLNALAYTQGKDIHFARGRYNPTRLDGQRIIGHELAHVMQQRAGNVASPSGRSTNVNSDPSLESEADKLGFKAARGQRVEWSPQHSSSGIGTPQGTNVPIQRWPDWDWWGRGAQYVGSGIAGIGGMGALTGSGIASAHTTDPLNDPTTTGLARAAGSAWQIGKGIEQIGSAMSGERDDRVSRLWDAGGRAAQAVGGGLMMGGGVATSAIPSYFGPMIGTGAFILGNTVGSVGRWMRRPSREDEDSLEADSEASAIETSSSGEEYSSTEDDRRRRRRSISSIV